jgi:anti-sigma regulatory factor (Ser/Thr protein kinase)
MMKVPMRVALPADASALALARSLVRDAVDDALSEADRQDLEVIATELVANAVRHGKPPFELHLDFNGAARVEVRDHEPGLPEPKSPTAEGGYGLMLIEALSRRWGATPLRSGKVVWAEL